MVSGNNKVKQIKRRLKKNPDLYDANIEMGIHYLKNNNLGTAIMHLEKAYRANGDDTRLIFILANAYEALNNIPKSEELLKKTIAIEPHNPEYLYNYGLLLQKTQRFEEAINVFERVAEIQPQNYELLNDIGVLYHLQKDHKKAARFLNRAIDANGNYTLAFINLAYVHIATNDLLSALKILERIDGIYGNNPEVIELKRHLDSAINNLREDNLDLETELSFSDRSFQITPLKIIKDFGEKKALDKVGLSIVIPVRDERDNIPILYNELVEVLNHLREPHEIIFINDGSIDGSGELLEEIAANDENVRVIQFRRNYGQTAAMSAGFKYAKGSVIITLDGDLQNDPKDIPRLLEKMSEGYDLVSGWRRERKDKFFTRKIPSLLANRIINWLISGTGIQLNDFGCTLKAYKRGIIKNINLYGEMHRFIPVFAAWLGVKVAEIPVNHRPRLHGVAKYNLSRVSRVFFDLIVIRFFSDYFTTPIQFFGRIAKMLAIIGIFIVFALSGLRILGIFSVSINTLIILASIYGFAILQIIFIGLLGEIMIRSYFETQGKNYYVVEKVIGSDIGTSYVSAR